MTLRWLIRSFAIALLTLCLSLWAWSYFRTFSILYSPSFNELYWVQTHMGGVYFYSDNISRLSPGWRFLHNRDTFPVSAGMFNKWFLGFTYFNMTRPMSGTWGFGGPFWFPSLLFAVLLWFIWRQTRPKTEARGFPVEVTQPNQICERSTAR